MLSYLRGNGRTKWPKVTPQLTPEQASINDDWQEYWFTINSGKYSAILAFGHEYVARHAPARFLRTLEVGAGLGDQLRYERLTDEQMSNYTALELRDNMANVLRQNWPKAQTVIGDCQKDLPFADGSFDRIIAIHLLEHLPDLPAFLRNVRRLLTPKTGRFHVVIPCEGGLGYTLGREVTSKRLFEKRYRLPYGPIIRAEHVNTAKEVLHELRSQLRVLDEQFFPLRVPSVDLNLLVGLTLTTEQVG